MEFDILGNPSTEKVFLRFFIPLISKGDSFNAPVSGFFDTICHRRILRLGSGQDLGGSIAQGFLHTGEFYQPTGRS